MRRRIGPLAASVLMAALAGCGSAGGGDSAPSFAPAENQVGSATLKTGQVKVIPVDKGKGSASLPDFRQGVLLASFMATDANERQLRYAATLGGVASASDASGGVVAFAGGDDRQRSVEAIQRSPRSQAQTALDNWLRHQSHAARNAGLQRVQALKTHQVGDVEPFWVDEQTGNGSNDTRKVQYPARLMAVTPHAYIYVDQRFLGRDGSFDDDAALQDVTKYFEEVAIPTDTRYFGNYPAPPGDVDGDPRLTVLFTKMYDGVVGYFDSQNSVPGPESNQRDMLYAGVEPFKDQDGVATVKATLIHELEHMIMYNYKDRLLTQQGQKALDETKFVDEGMAVVAEQLGGLAFPSQEPVSISYIFEFLQDNPSAQLIDEGDGYLYGAGYLFNLYLMEQYGADVLKKLVQSNKTGIANVEQATGRKFADIFRDWSIALYATGYSADPRYNFKSVKLRGAYAGKQLDGLKATPAAAFPTSETVKAKPWSIIPVSFTGGQGGSSLSLNLNGSKGTGLEATLLDTSTLREP